MAKQPKQATQPKKWLCRVGNHRVYQNELAVKYENGMGICINCINNKAGRLAEYWTTKRQRTD